MCEIVLMKMLSCSKYFFLKCLLLVFFEKNQHKNSMEKKKRLEASFQQKHQTLYLLLGHNKSKGNRTRDGTETCRSSSTGLLSNPCTRFQKCFKKEDPAATLRLSETQLKFHQSLTDYTEPVVSICD